MPPIFYTRNVTGIPVCLLFTKKFIRLFSFSREKTSPLQGKLHQVCLYLTLLGWVHLLPSRDCQGGYSIIFMCESKRKVWGWKLMNVSQYIYQNFGVFRFSFIFNDLLQVCEKICNTFSCWANKHQQFETQLVLQNFYIFTWIKSRIHLLGRQLPTRSLLCCVVFSFVMTFALIGSSWGSFK